MKTLILFFTFSLFFIFTLSTFAQTKTETETIENWIMGYNCGDEAHILEGVVVTHNIRFLNPLNGKFVRFKHTAHGELLSSNGEVFRLNHTYKNDWKQSTKTWHYNLIGDQGTHLLYVKKTKWTRETGDVIIKEELRCL